MRIQQSAGSPQPAVLTMHDMSFSTQNSDATPVLRCNVHLQTRGIRTGDGDAFNTKTRDLFLFMTEPKSKIEPDNAYLSSQQCGMPGRGVNHPSWQNETIKEEPDEEEL